MTDFEKALLNPVSVYKEPKDVLADDTLTREQKIKVLRQWEYDAKELQTADDENMPVSEQATMLHRALEALRELEQ